MKHDVELVTTNDIKDFKSGGLKKKKLTDLRKMREKLRHNLSYLRDLEIGYKELQAETLDEIRIAIWMANGSKSEFPYFSRDLEDLKFTYNNFYWMLDSMIRKKEAAQVKLQYTNSKISRKAYDACVYTDNKPVFETISNAQIISGITL